MNPCLVCKARVQPQHYRNKEIHTSTTQVSMSLCRSCLPFTRNTHDDTWLVFSLRRSILVLRSMIFKLWKECICTAILILFVCLFVFEAGFLGCPGTLKFIEIQLPLPLKCWNWRHVSPCWTSMFDHRVLCTGAPVPLSLREQAHVTHSTETSVLSLPWLPTLNGFTRFCNNMSGIMYRVFFHVKLVFS